jgi:FtsP/CotA-like multicopper oxidase with cupredoxin domain
MVSRGKAVAVVLLVGLIVAVVAFVTGIVVLPPPRSSGIVTPPVVTKSTCDRPPGFFLIIADLSGFNDSISHGAPANPWPVIRVQQGDEVRILVCNKDTTQPHGFAIGTYFPAGVTIAPGESYRIVFTATVPGTFVMYCNIFCTVHVFMVSRLIVEPSTSANS